MLLHAIEAAISFHGILDDGAWAPNGPMVQGTEVVAASMILQMAGHSFRGHVA